jgi:beta-lactamase class D
MKKLLQFYGTLLCLLISLNSSVWATQNCFLAKENGKVLKIEGNCHKRYAPESTFKIPLSLMAFDAGVLKDKNNLSWPCKGDYDYYINVCKGDHDPRTWMRDSCVWYSQLLTSHLGMEKFRDYVEKFNYGNMDLCGDKGENNGLSRSWLSSSLQISPHEQVDFFQKIIDQKLFLTQESYNKTKEIMFIQELAGGWKLYGKRGSGKQRDSKGNKTEIQHGWFVGYIEKRNKHIVFASHIADRKKQNTVASFRARNEALIKLWHIIDQQEK